MHLVEDISAYASFLEHCAHSLWQAELHNPAVGDDQRMSHPQALEVVCHLACGTRPKLDRRHLHREDGFVGNIKATHTVFSQGLSL
jgi:hypothetical protein